MAASGITIEDIREFFGEIDAEEIPDSTIQAALDSAEIIITERLAGVEVSADLRAEAVKIVAARRSYLSTPIEERRSALDATTQWDVETFADYLAEQEREIFELVGKTAGGSSAGFATATRGAFSGSSHEKGRDL